MQLPAHAGLLSRYKHLFQHARTRARTMTGTCSREMEEQCSDDAAGAYLRI
jgi:hypothetical protein